MRELLRSLPDKLHACTSTIVGPAGITPQLTDHTDPTSRQADVIHGSCHHPLDIETLATVFNANGQATAVVSWRHLQMQPYIAFLKFVQPGIALLIITRKTRCIALEA